MSVPLQGPYTTATLRLDSNSQPVLSVTRTVVENGRKTKKLNRTFANNVSVPALGAQASNILFSPANVSPLSWSATDQATGNMYRVTLLSRRIPSKASDEKNGGQRNEATRPIASLVIEALDAQLEERFLLYATLFDLVRLRKWCQDNLPPHDLFGAFMLQCNGSLMLKAGGGAFVSLPAESLPHTIHAFTRAIMGRPTRFSTRNIRVSRREGSPYSFLSVGGTTSKIETPELHRVLLYLERFAFEHTDESVEPPPPSSCSAVHGRSIGDGVSPLRQVTGGFNQPQPPPIVGDGATTGGNV